MEKSKQTYWAVFHQQEIMFSGTFTQCWNFFVESCGGEKVSALVKSGYRIGRK